MMKRYWLRFAIVFFLIAVNDLFAQDSVYIDSLLTEIKNTGMNEHRIDLMNKVASAYLVSNADKAEKYAKNALKLARAKDYEEGMKTGYNNLGNINFIKGNYPESLMNYLSLLEIQEKRKDSIGIANSFMGIGNVYYVQKDYESAIDYQFQSINIRRKLGDSTGIAGNYNNLGAIYMDIEDYSKALEFHLKSLEIKKKARDKSALSSSYGNIGNIYRKLNQLDKAYEFQIKAFAIRKESNNLKGLVMSYNDLGHILSEKKDYRAALERHLEAYKLARSINYGEGIMSACQGIAEKYELMNNPSDALKYQKILLSFKDSVFNHDKSALIADMRTRYETDKKEQTIDLLSKEKEIKELRLLAQQGKINQQRTIILLILVGFLIFLVAALLLLRLYRFKKRANIILEERNIEILRQKEVIDQKNKDITDSIEYAQSIQKAMISGEEDFKRLFADFFVLLRPKEMVSGDFFWIHQTIDDRVLWTAADCTGHGVPGAFMSVLAISVLNEIVIRSTVHYPASILEELRQTITASLHNKNQSTSGDGVDLALCVLDRDTNLMRFAGINNDVLVIQNGEYNLIKGNKQPAGYVSGSFGSIDEVEIQLNKGDLVYMYSDGYYDQFGCASDNSEENPKFEKFRYKRFVSLLEENCKLPLADQKELLKSTLQKWMGKDDNNKDAGCEQIDDICIVGVKI